MGKSTPLSRGVSVTRPKADSLRTIKKPAPAANQLALVKPERKSAMSSHVGQICSVCANERRSEIDAAITAGVRSMADISRTYALSRQSLMRHRDNHIVADIKAVIARQREDDSYNRGASVLDRMHQLGAEAHAALTAAKDSKDTRLILSAISTAGRLLELQAKISGEIGTGGDTTINVTMNDFRQLQVNIVQALEKFPDAKAAVLAALSAPAISQ